MSAERTLHLVGIGVKHSIAPPMQNFISNSLDLPWTFYSTECPTLDDVVSLARNETTVGLVVTMPYKNAIMARLDGLDDLATTIGACNNVYRDPNDPKRILGTNTDWLGIKGCLLEGGHTSEPSLNRPALIVGAGGASRAAVYALSTYFKSSVIYVLNRDDGEVADLCKDSQKLLPSPPKIIHVKEQSPASRAKSLETPFYIVGTVPDLEPKSQEELEVKASLHEFLSRPEKGVLLDMCFKPRETRMIKSARELGWSVVEGTHVIGYQIEQQWRLWAGEERARNLDSKGAWGTLLKAADESTAIN